MSKYIEAEWLIARIPSEEMIAKMAVAHAPTIDIVHCRECKHKYQEPWLNGVKVESECEIWHNATLDDDFCSYGEREVE